MKRPENVYYLGIKGLHLLPGTKRALEQLKTKDGANSLVATADSQHQLSVDDRKMLLHALNVLAAAEPYMTDETSEFNVLLTALSYVNCFFNDAQYDEDKVDRCRILFQQYDDRYHAQSGYEPPKVVLTQLITKMKSEIHIGTEITADNGLLDNLRKNENVEQIAKEIIEIKNEKNPELRDIINKEVVINALRVLQKPVAGEAMLKAALKFLNTFYFVTGKDKDTKEDIFTSRQGNFEQLYRLSNIVPPSSPTPPASSMPPQSRRPSASQISAIRMGSRKNTAATPIQTPTTTPASVSPPASASQKSKVIMGLRRKADKAPADPNEDTKANVREMKK